RVIALRIDGPVRNGTISSSEMYRVWPCAAAPASNSNSHPIDTAYRARIRSSPPRSGCETSRSRARRECRRSRPGRPRERSDLEEVLAIVAELADRIVDVREREVHRLLLEPLADLRRPEPHEYLQRRDVEVAVMEVRGELRHVAHEKAPV